MNQSAGKPEFSGNRTFQYVRAKGKRPNEYEEISQSIQQDPSKFATLGWPMRFVGGEPPYSDDTSRVRATDWWAFSDPDKQLFRSYVAMQAAQEESIDEFVDMSKATGTLAELDPVWTNEVVGTVYAAYACVEWGLFRALAAAQRDARSDVISFTTVFNSGDKLRHAHDIALYDIALSENRDDFDSKRGSEAWLADPRLQPMRKMVEEIMFANDWVEIIVAINCAFEPRVGEMVRRELLTKHGAINGDGVTPMIVATAERDWHRNRRWTDELLRMLLDDTTHGAHNRETIQGWIAKWSAAADEACEALRPFWDLPPRKVSSFDEAFESVKAVSMRRLRDVGLGKEDA